MTTIATIGDAGRIVTDVNSALSLFNNITAFPKKIGEWIGKQIGGFLNIFDVFQDVTPTPVIPTPPRPIYQKLVEYFRNYRDQPEIQRSPQPNNAPLTSHVRPSNSTRIIFVSITQVNNIDNTFAASLPPVNWRALPSPAQAIPVSTSVPTNEGPDPNFPYTYIHSRRGHR